MRRPSFRSMIALIAAFTCLAAAPERGLAEDCVVQHVNHALFFDGVAIGDKLSRLRQLERRTVAEYFPEVETILLQNGQTRSRTRLDAASLDRFKKEFDELLELRKAYERFPADEVRLQLTRQFGAPYPPLTASSVETYRIGEMTLRDLQTQFWHEFTEKTGVPQALDSWPTRVAKTYTSLKSPYSLATRALAQAKKLISFHNTYWKAAVGIQLGTVTAIYLAEPWKYLIHSATQPILDQASELTASAQQAKKSHQEIALIQEALLKVRFADLAPEERLHTWRTFADQLERESRTLGNTLAKAKKDSAPAPSELGPISFMTARQSLVASLHQLSGKRDIGLAQERTRTLSMLKALRMTSLQNGIPNPENGEGERLIQAELAKLAEEAELFQQFVNEFVRIQRNES